MNGSDKPHDWYSSQPTDVSTVGKTPVDARVRGNLFRHTCEFNGHHAAKDGKRFCKYYLKSKHREHCYHCRETITENGQRVCLLESEGTK